MTEKKENYGSLSKSLRDFLLMENEEERKKKYGNGVHKMYERVVKNIDKSFQDNQIALIHLPEQYRNKLDLVYNYESMLREIKKQKIAMNLPDKAIGSILTELELFKDRKKLDPRLRQLLKKDFDKVIEWLRYLEPKGPIIQSADI